MKILNGTLCALLLIALSLTACKKDDESNQSAPPTAEEFQSLRQTALDNITQNFQIDLQNGAVSLISEQGVQLEVYYCNNASGSGVDSIVYLEFAEIFDRGTMLVTNKPTMGILSSGEEGILISGGEFFFNATENGTQLEACNVQVTIPVDLTGGIDYRMSFWTGNIDANDNLTWVPGSSTLSADSSNYSVFINDFGWFNCDYLWDDPRPITDITIEVPAGYDNTNSGVYFLIVGESPALATLGNSGGQLPIGLETHFIFVTAEDDDWRYAVKSVTISENEVVTFELGDTAVVTESELIDIINALP